MDHLLTQQFTEVRDKFVKNFAYSNQYGKLTQSYVQKSFTIFNLLLSIVVDEKLLIIASTVLNTQHELIETQLNIKYLYLCQFIQNNDTAHDISSYETEIMKFITKNHPNNSIISQLLPSIKDLYYILDHKRDFYPFGVIRTYEILGMLIAPADAFEKNPELQRLTIVQLIEMMNAANNEEDVDDVSESMWKFITAHLNHCQINPIQVATEQIENMLSLLRNFTQSYKSSSLRQTVTEIISKLIQYFAESTDVELIIDFAEISLSLLRDDDIYVRNRASEIVMELIHYNGAKKSVEKGKNIQILF